MVNNFKTYYFLFPKCEKDHLSLSLPLPHTSEPAGYLYVLVISLCHLSNLFYVAHYRIGESFNANKQIHLFPEILLPFKLLFWWSQGTVWPVQPLSLLAMGSCQDIAISLWSGVHFAVIIAHLGCHLSVQAARGRNGILVSFITTPLNKKGCC